MKLLRPTLFVFLLIQASFILAQNSVKETSNSTSSQKKALSLDEQAQAKIQFVGLLKNAEKQSNLDAAHKILVTADKRCDTDKINGCDAKLDESVQAIFDKWVERYQSQIDVSQATRNLEDLKSKFCEGSLKDHVDCGSVGSIVKDLSNNESQAEYQKYIDQAKATNDLDDKLDALNKAEAICESFLKDECRSEITTLKKQAYLRAFQTKVRHLRSSNASYDTKKEKLEELYEVVEKGDLSDLYRNQYENLRQDIHEKEIERLITQGGDYEDQLREIRRARKIDEEELNNAMRSRIDDVVIDLVDDELDRMLSRSRRRGNFQRYLNQIEDAEELLDDLPESARNRRQDRLQNYRQDVVRDELIQRQREVDRTNDWRAALDGYNRLLNFAADYRDDLERGTATRLKREREGFLITEYEARIQQSLGMLQQRDLQGAQLALSGAVELTSTGFLPDSPAAYRHREVYQKIYEEYHNQLQSAKGRRNWAAAEQTIQLIDNLYQDAPFILVRNSLEEELILLDVARFEEQLDRAGSVVRNEPMEKQYGFFNELVFAYQELNPYLNNAHRDQLGRVVFDLSKQPLDAARNAIQKENYALAINELAGLNQFLYQDGYTQLLPKRPYDELNQLTDHSFNKQNQVFSRAISYIKNNDQERQTIGELGQYSKAVNDFQGWDNRSAKSGLRDLYGELLNAKKQRVIQRMQAGRFGYQTDLSEMQSLQSTQSEFVSNASIETIANELAFYEAYEQGKAALRRGNYQPSMDYFMEAQSRVEALPRNEQFEKTDLLLRGQRMSLEGLLTTQIEQNSNLGTSSRRRVYKDILKTTRTYAEVGLTENAERALQDLELDWFGGACRTDYRKYSLHVVDAEMAIEKEAYEEALTFYRSALPFESRVSRCMVPVEEVQKEINFYQLAADFQERKANIDQLKAARKWQQLDKDYNELWTAFIEYGIQQKFGYTMQPFGQYVLNDEDPDLMYYFVENHSTDNAQLDYVREGLRKLSYRSSKSRMQTLGADVARQMYYQQPDKDYKKSFRYFVPSGKASKTFKQFEKGYKKQWKKSWKSS